MNHLWHLSNTFMTVVVIAQSWLLFRHGLQLAKLNDAMEAVRQFAIDLRSVVKFATGLDAIARIDRVANTTQEIPVEDKEEGDFVGDYRSKKVTKKEEPSSPPPTLTSPKGMVLLPKWVLWSLVVMAFLNFVGILSLAQDRWGK